MRDRTAGLSMGKKTTGEGEKNRYFKVIISASEKSLRVYLIYSFLLAFDLVYSLFLENFLLS